MTCQLIESAALWIGAMLAGIGLVMLLLARAMTWDAEDEEHWEACRQVMRGGEE